MAEQRELTRTILAARDDETTTFAATRAMNERDTARADGAREERRLCLQDIEDEVETNHYATGEARALRAAQRRIRARGEGGGR